MNCSYQIARSWVRLRPALCRTGHTARARTGLPKKEGHGGVIEKGDGLALPPTGRVAIKTGKGWELCFAQLGCRGNGPLIVQNILSPNSTPAHPSRAGTASPGNGREATRSGERKGPRGDRAVRGPDCGGSRWKPDDRGETGWAARGGRHSSSVRMPGGAGLPGTQGTGDRRPAVAPHYGTGGVTWRKPIEVPSPTSPFIHTGRFSRPGKARV